MDLKSLLFGQEEWQFLLNTFVRTTVMFLVILVGLRMLGKRGIHQLSVFELGVIIGLGSAAGDPMFYKDVGILPSVVVFIVVISMYRLVTYLISKSDRIETIIEGTATYILKEGIILEAFKSQPLGRDEFLATLRQKQVFHLGQVETVVMESDSQLSIFFYPDDKVRYGLPILPEALSQTYKKTSDPGVYSCFACGNTQELKPNTQYSCPRCNHDKCVKSLNGQRVR
ncbi:MAG TPA: YetF domain-containing protein [Chryseosolibacter sp.]|nr:YetF domain-containing protein [Chryseosolibacter sp.]